MDRKNFSAPPLKNKNEEKNSINRKVSHRRSTGNCKQKQNSIKISPSSSLQSLTSILKPSSHSNLQQSAPNVSFDDERNRVVKSRSISKSSVNDKKTTDNLSQYQTAAEKNGENFKSINMLAADGSLSTQQSTAIGFKASFFSVLEKVWRRSQSNIYKAPTSEIKTSERHTARNSIASLYFRTFHGGKFFTK